MLIQTLTGYFELKDNFTKHSHLQITFLKDKKPKQTNKTNKQKTTVFVQLFMRHEYPFLLSKTWLWNILKQSFQKMLSKV